MSPYQPSQQRPEMPPAAPRRSGAITTVAIVSIVLGLCCGIGSLYQLFTPQMMKMQKQSMAIQQKTMSAEIEQTKTRRLEELQKERDAATDAEKPEIDARIKKTEAMKAPDITKVFDALAPENAQHFYIVSGLTGALIQALLLATGIGLLSLRRWARTGNIAASVLQILLSIGTFVYQMTTVSPAVTKAMQDIFAEIGEAAEGAEVEQLKSMGSIMGTMMTASAGAAMFISLLWFTIAICLLSSRRSKEIFATAP